MPAESSRARSCLLLSSRPSISSHVGRLHPCKKLKSEKRGRLEHELAFRRTSERRKFIEAFWILAGLAIVGLVGLAAVAGPIAFFLVRRADKRLEALAHDVAVDLAGTTRRLERIDERLARIEQGAAGMDREQGEAPSKETADLAPAPPPSPGPESVPVPHVVSSATPPPSPPAIPAREPVSEPPAPRPVAREATSPGQAAAATSSPSPAEAPPSASLPAPPRSKSAIDWESWVGVKGAAVMGGIVLALAGILLFKYSIERGLISPPVRVALGAIAGVAFILTSERVRRKKLGPTADALAGAGVVALYAATWAAHSLYGLIGPVLALTISVVITAACCVLAGMHRSLAIAVLGLLGGFVTPLVLPQAFGEAPGLFSYLLLLDVGLLALARWRQWPALAMVSLAATAVHQTAHFWSQESTEQGIFGLALLAVFAALFVAAGVVRGREEPSGASWLVAQAGGVLLPFVFAFRLAQTAAPNVTIVAFGALLTILSAAAAWLDLKLERSWLARAAAAGSLAVVAAWMASTTISTPIAWKLAAVCLAMTAVHPIVRRIRPGTAETRREMSLSAVPVAAVGFLLLTVGTVATRRGSSDLWPWLALWLGLAAILLWDGGGRRAVFSAIGIAGTALGLTAYASGAHWSPSELSPAAWVTVAAAVALLFQGVVIWQGRGRSAPFARWLERGAASAALIPAITLALLVGEHDFSGLTFFGASLGLGLLAALSALRISAGRWYIAAVATTALVHSSRAIAGLIDEESGLGLLACLAGVVLFTGLPFAASKRHTGDRKVWIGAALAGPFWFVTVRSYFEVHFGDSAVGLVAVGLGLISYAAAEAVRRQSDAAPEERKSRLVWFAAVAIGFAAVAVPLQVDKEWVTIGWALQGAALLALWRRLDHPGLKYVALALLAVASARLALNPAVLGYHERSAFPVFNWLAYTYLVPVAALLAGMKILLPLEVERSRRRERTFDAASGRQLEADGGKPWGAILCASAAVVVGFVWLNLTIFDAYSRGSTIEFALENPQARDLTLSLAWAVYAVLLLGIGIGRRISALRWTGFGFLLLTLVKVFLYDLGELDDLWRVASLVGLAVSLLAVSAAFHRFTVRLREERDSEAGDAKDGETPEGEA